MIFTEMQSQWEIENNSGGQFIYWMTLFVKLCGRYGLRVSVRENSPRLSIESLL
jgi:hypothetical protein